MTSGSLMPGLGSVRDRHIEQLACSTNEILSSQDQGIIHKLFSKVQGGIDSLDADISRLETVLDGLKERRALSVERMMRLRIGIAPQKNLPPEILAKIFVECADNKEQEVLIPRQRAACMSWDLGQVCTRWRGIARNVPLLWANINASLGGDNNLSLAVFHLLHDVLSNCGGRGRVQLKTNPTTHNDWIKLLDLVATYSSRLWSLDLQLDGACLEHLSLPIQAFDNLRSLSLSFLNDVYTDQTSILAFCRSGNIDTVALNLDVYPHLPGHQQWMFPWAPLTVLTLTYIAPDSVLLILSHCSLLTKLAVGLVAGRDTHPYAMELPISLAHLQLIFVYFDPDNVLDNLLSHLVLPSLQDYCYTGGEESPGFDPSEFLALVKRSACLITSLDIHDFIFDPEVILTMMRALPTLTNLTILPTEPISDSILSIIKTENLIPNLQEFDGFVFSSVHSAVEFLNSRWSQTTPGHYDGFRHLQFWIWRDDYTPDDQKYFESLLPELEKDGRRVELHVLGHDENGGSQV